MTRVLALALGRPWLACHAGVLLLIGLAVLVEGGEGVGTRTLLAWRQLVPGVAVLAAHLAWRGSASVRTALASLGAGDGLGRLLMAGYAMVPAVAAGALAPTAAWVRAEGGWYHLGRAIADVPGGSVGAPGGGWEWSVVVVGTLAGVLGYAPWRPGVLVLLVAAVVLGVRVGG